MATGRRIELADIEFTDPAAPVLAEIDAIESAGSLVLLDWAHPASTLAIDALPAHGATPQNILLDLGTALLGSAPAMTFDGNAASFGSGKGLLERSAKGGIHGILSPTLADGASRYRVLAGTNIEQYFLNNPTHSFFFSVWGRITKAAAPSTSGHEGPRFEIVRTTTPASNYLAILSETLGTRTASAVGPALLNTAKSSWTGTIPASTTEEEAVLMTAAGGSNLNYTDTQRRAQGAFIHYRTYIEDMTVSGRTYAQVDAIDYALYTREVLTAGGRYYGDTYTDPATIP